MATLPHTVHSVLSQTHTNLEHIFVDGGSTDGTLDFIEGLLPPRTILYDVVGGISQAMNAGLAVAQGDVVCHLHSDDYLLHPRVLERVALHFEISGVDWLFGRILNDTNGAITAEPFRVPQYSYARLLRGNFIPHQAAFIRKNLFDLIGGFREDLKLAMDYEFFLRLGLRYEPLALLEVFTVFRRHEGSATQRNRLASFEEDYKVRLEYSSCNPVERLLHAARYYVRRRRITAHR